MNWYDPLLKKSDIKKKIKKEKRPGRRWCRAESTIIDEKVFQSKLEAGVYLTLKSYIEAGTHKNLRCHVSLRLIGNLKNKMDFVIFNIARNCDEAHEAKGKEFARFVAIKQAWPGCMDMDLFIWKGSYEKHSIEKVIRGKYYQVMP